MVATANLSSKVYLDSTLVGDVPKVVTLGASGITPYLMGTTACTLAPTAFTAGTTMGTATSGSLWMTPLKDKSGNFHLMANEGTTAVKYYNSTSNNFTAAWNSSSPVETTTLGAASGGGADIDNSTNGIYLSYGINVVPFDLHLARVTNDTVASNLATYTLLTPDLSGNIQLGAAGSQLRNIAIASTNTGVVGVAYVDFSVGAGPRPNSNLRSARATLRPARGIMCSCQAPSIPNFRRWNLIPRANLGLAILRPAPTAFSY